MTQPLVRRRDAAQATMDRFNGAAFAWSTNDCARLAAFHARRMGHAAPMPKAGSYKTPQQAVRALKKATGHSRMEDALEHHLGFLPIPPARVLVGDLVALESDDGGDWPALFVVLGNGRAFGFIDGIAQVMEPVWANVRGAWLVNPKGDG